MRRRERPGPRLLCVVLHDVAGSTRAACERTLAAVREVAAVPVTHLVVPRYHGQTPTADFEAWVGAQGLRGDELSLHGYTHRDDGADEASGLDHLRRSHYTRGEGEFSALPAAEAKTRIDAGVAWFAAHGWPLHGFVAPAWLLGPGGWSALAGEPAGGGKGEVSRDAHAFLYTSTLREIIHLPSGRRLRSQSIVYSTSRPWRRRMSLAWNAAVARAERSNPLLRIELHPRDADFADVRRSWQRILEAGLRDRRAVTVMAAVDEIVGTGADRAATELAKGG